MCVLGGTQIGRLWDTGTTAVPAAEGSAFSLYRGPQPLKRILLPEGPATAPFISLN